MPPQNTDEQPESRELEMTAEGEETGQGGRIDPANPAFVPDAQAGDAQDGEASAIPTDDTGSEDADNPEDTAPVDEDDLDDEDVDAEAAAEDRRELGGVLEALIFASDEPLSFKQIKEILAPSEAGLDEDEERNRTTGRGPRKRRAFTITRVKNVVDALNEEYEAQDRAFRIIEVSGGFAFQTIAAYGIPVGKLFAERSRRRLTQSALETLAIIAFRQPISKPAIEAIRGVNAEHVVKSLLERNLIAIVGRDDSVGRPLLYGTTKTFLRHFGLRSLNDLPKPREIQDLLSEGDDLVVNPIEELDPDEARKLTAASSVDLERLFATAQGGDDKGTEVDGAPGSVAKETASRLHVRFDSGDVQNEHASPEDENSEGAAASVTTEPEGNDTLLSDGEALDEGNGSDRGDEPGDDESDMGDDVEPAEDEDEGYDEPQASRGEDRDDT